MSAYPMFMGRPPTRSRPTGAGHADVLDAWLGTVAPPADDREGAAVAVGRPINWNAPVCPVALAYDTGQQGLPSGVRLAMREGNRRLMFEADAYEVMLRVASDRQNERYEVAGQVLFEGLPLPGAMVRLDRNEPSTAISTDQAGGFRLPPLVHGACTLSIAVDGAVLAVPPIALS
jgi:hypothetical protein